jgi:hypothetical protein
MRTFRDVVIAVLRKRGAMEIRTLVKAALRLMPRKADPTQKVLNAAIGGAWGIRVVEWPRYALRVPAASVVLPPYQGYVRTALMALRDAGPELALPGLAERYRVGRRYPPRCAEYEMWLSLARQRSRLVARTGALRIDLTEALRRESDQKVRRRRAHPTGAAAPIAERIDEKSLETLLVNRPELLEVGLTVFQRQCRIPVGIIDLLCIDKNRNYVVVEIKRPSADYREVVGQITSYMGWVRRHVAGSGQLVRGIVVIGRRSDKLDYSLELVPEVSVRTFF